MVSSTQSTDPSFTGLSQTHPWFAVHVRPGREAYTGSLMETKDLTVFCPTYRQTAVRSTGRRATIRTALFPGYLFCQIDLNNRLPVLETTWVDSIVSVARAPVPIPDSEIASLQTLIAHAPDPQPDEYLAVGQPVRVIDGPLAGVEGAITRTRDKYRVVVAITLLQRAVSAEVDRGAVLPLNQPPQAVTLQSRRAVIYA